jgi:DNA repair exonuclease SbcCD ATPase subunit
MEMSKKMRLMKLIARNFKGFKYFTLDANGDSLMVFGDNGTGKTSVADAVSWLFFGKDTQNKTEFGIKTMNNGVVIPAISHEVEGIFLIDGNEVSLKKEYVEKYTEKRGGITSKFTGHKTNHFIDGVPKSKGEYEKYIASIVNEDVFRLLTNPTYFNEQLHWEDKRKTLLDICGDISDEDVITSDKALVSLPSILKGRTLDDHKKVIAARRKAINEELEKIPGLINENNLMKPDLIGLDKELIAAEIQDLTEKRNAKNQEANRIEQGGEIAEQQKLLRESESRLLDIQTKFRKETSDIKFAKEQSLGTLKSNLMSIESLIKSKDSTIKNNNNNIENYKKQRENLLASWYTENDKVFTPSSGCDCPTCGQSLPQNRIDEANKKALSQFNLAKSETLKSIDGKGKQLVVEINNLHGDNGGLNLEIITLASDKTTLEVKIAALQTEIDAIEIPDIATNIEYANEHKFKESILAKINVLRTETNSLIAELDKESKELSNQINEKSSTLLKFKQAEDIDKRINELAKKQETLSAEFEKLEQELFLTEQFTRTKVNMLEERINSKFKFTRFKMFDVQVNGGIDECCTALGPNGVPYGAGLNQAARTNVGLDIINTLSDYYGFEAPIFIDNRESVVRLIETRAQLINLVVSEPDKVLRVERQ